jgi:hypothetical protein
VREIKEAQAIQESIDKNKGLPKRFRINNLLVDVDYSIQTKLIELSEVCHFEFTHPLRSSDSVIPCLQNFIGIENLTVGKITPIRSRNRPIMP